MTIDMDEDQWLDEQMDAIRELGDAGEGALDFIRTALDGAPSDAARGALREVVGPWLAEAGRLAEAEEQERALVAHLLTTEPPEAERLARAELRLAVLLRRAGRGAEAEGLLRDLVARVGAPSGDVSSGLVESLVGAYAELVRLLSWRGSEEAGGLEGTGRRLAALSCDRPVAEDVLRSLVGPFDPEGVDPGWIAGDRALMASYGALSNPSAVDEAGLPTRDGIRSEVVFGPLRDFACSCGRYVGFREWGVVCEVCRVEVVAAGTRRWRFGHVPLASPVVHPAAVGVIALLLDIGEDEVLALRDLESADPSGPDELQGRLRDLDLEGEAERLAEARAQGRIRGSAQLLERRAATIAALLAQGIRPEDTILRAIPVLPPDIDVTAHPRLGGVDRAEVERAYGRLLAANAEVARLVEGGAANADEPRDGSPLREARRALQRAADSLFGSFSSLPVHASTTPLGETHTPPFELPAGAVLTPSFSIGSAVFRAGKAFVLDDPAVGRPLLVTCLHLFGPAGGLPEQLSSRQVAWTISGATLLDAFEGIEMAESERAIEVPGARADEDVSDVAALLLPSPGRAARLHLSEEDVRDGERVSLAAPVRAGAPLSQRLHPATVLGRTVSGSILLELDVRELDVAGTSGAPVLCGTGAVAGMFVRFRRGEESGILLGTMVPASRLRGLLRAAADDLAAAPA